MIRQAGYIDCDNLNSCLKQVSVFKDNYEKYFCSFKLTHVTHFANSKILHFKGLKLLWKSLPITTFWTI